MIPYDIIPNMKKQYYITLQVDEKMKGDIEKFAYGKRRSVGNVVRIAIEAVLKGKLEV